MSRSTYLRMPAGVAILSYVLFLALSSSTVAQNVGHKTHAESATKLVDVVRDPSDVPAPISYTAAALVRVTLTAQEVLGTLDPETNSTYRYWTFNGKVPGPMIRVRQGDTIELTLRNDGTSHMAHSIDLHAALGPGGGAALTQVVPGQTKSFTFRATTPGLYVYHCGTPMIAEHMANGMYGLILVEPEGGLPHVDHEYYLMQGEVYTAAPKGKEGFQQFSATKLMAEAPEYFVFNGAVGAVMNSRALKANVGDTVRVFFGNAGPNQAAATHAVGEIFTKVYEDGSLTTAPMTNIQTVGVPPGSAAVLEFAAQKPGNFALMDHSIARMAKGLMAAISVSGTDNPDLMHAGEATPDQVARATVQGVTGMTQADAAQAGQPIASAPAGGGALPAAKIDRMSMLHMGMEMDESAAQPIHMGGPHAVTPAASQASAAQPTAVKRRTLNGCLTLATDGKAILNVFQSSKKYRLEARPLQFSENANRFVQVSGYFGSVVTDEDPNLPSFVVDAIDSIATSCSSNITAAQIHKVLLKRTQVAHGVVGMTDMGFSPATITINAGEKVTWTNTSQVTHNVIADARRAVVPVDIKLPAGATPFGSAMLQPGQKFSRTFDVPGIYRYVCTLHETSGMKGIIIVKGAQVLRAQK
jgi:copper-containing nitrite reductase